MDKRGSEALARFEAVVMAARSRAGGRGLSREERIAAILADPEVIAVRKEPAVRDAVITREAERLLSTEPDLLRAAENRYPGAKERLLSKLEMKLRKKRARLPLA